MKKRYTLIFLLISLSAFGQQYDLSTNYHWSKEQLTFNTKRIYVVFKNDSIPFRAYSNDIDFYDLVNNKPYTSQEVNLYYPSDSVLWSPGTEAQVKDIYYPITLPDKFLSKRPIYVVMQRNSFHRVDKAFTNPEKCKAYAAFFKTKVIEVLYTFRDSTSYKEVLKLQKQKYK